MTTQRKYKTTTPTAVRDCINAGMSLRRTAEYLDVSLSGLRQACSLFNWHPRGWSGPVHNNATLPLRVHSAFLERTEPK